MQLILPPALIYFPWLVVKRLDDKPRLYGARFTDAVSRVLEPMQSELCNFIDDDQPDLAMLGSAVEMCGVVYASTHYLYNVRKFNKPAQHEALWWIKEMSFHLPRFLTGYEDKDSVDGRRLLSEYDALKKKWKSSDEEAKAYLYEIPCSESYACSIPYDLMGDVPELDE
jgi:hypothetical protein